jgi:germination protein M
MKKALCTIVILAIILLSGCSLLSNAASDNTNKGSNATPTAMNAPTATPVQSDSGNEIKSKTVTLYYQDKDGYIIPVTRKVGDVEGIARTAIQGLIDDPATREEIENFGVYAVLPKDTEILGLTIKDNTATIDFNDKLLEYKSEAQERNIISSVVYTLTEFSTIKNVKILVNDSSKTQLKYGTDISGKLNRENVLINTNKVNINPDKEKFDIFLSKVINEKYTYMIPISIETDAFSNADLPKEIINVLTKKYDSNGLYTALPPKVKILDSKISEGTLELDFSSEIGNYGGNAREKTIVNQILYSMKQISGITKVKFLINGDIGTLPEGTDISEAMAIPAVINDYIDK